MLMQKVDGEWTPWNGEVIDNTIYPLNIETLWTDEELAKIGLFPLTNADIPLNKVATDWRIEDVEGEPVRTPTLIDTPKPVPTLEDRLSVIEKMLGIS